MAKNGVTIVAGRDDFAKEFASIGARGLSAAVQLGTESTGDEGTSLAITLVNTSEEEDAVRPFYPRFYEAKL